MIDTDPQQPAHRLEARAEFEIDALLEVLTPQNAPPDIHDAGDGKGMAGEENTSDPKTSVALPEKIGDMAVARYQPPTPGMTYDRPADSYALIRIDRILDRPYGRNFDSAQPSNQVLARDISNRGVRTPLLVRPVANGRFEIINGALRLACARFSESYEIPCVIRNIDRAQAMIERIQDEQTTRRINPLELASTLWAALKIALELDDRALRSWLEWTRINCTAGIPKNDTWNVPGTASEKRNAVDLLRKMDALLAPIMRTTTLQTSYMPLLSLPDSIRKLLESDTISASVARELAAIKDEDFRSAMIARVVEVPSSFRKIRKEIRIHRDLAVTQKPNDDAIENSPGFSTQLDQRPVVDSFAGMAVLLDRAFSGSLGQGLADLAHSLSNEALAIYHLALEADSQMQGTVQNEPEAERASLN